MPFFVEMCSTGYSINCSSIVDQGEESYELGLVEIGAINEMFKWDTVGIDGVKIIKWYVYMRIFEVILVASCQWGPVRYKLVRGSKS